MTPAPGDLVVLNTAAIAWAEVADGVYELPDTSSNNDKVHVLSGEHGIVRRTLGLVAFVFFSQGRTALLQRDQLTVVCRPLPPDALTRAFRTRTG